MTKELYIYNTLTKKKELFTPLNDEFVTLYSCGPTVYSTPHIGNMRAYSFVDTLTRTLKAAGYNVKNLINITDVGHLTSDEDHGDDKLALAAKKSKKSAYEIAEEYTSVFYRYLELLNIKKPYMFPKATDHIQEQIEMVKALEEKGYTYKTSDGIYFDTDKFEKYTELANINIEGLKEGARVDFGEKRNVTDFALWKFSPENEKRDMEWESPWGKGFPGWHIECSAMAMKHLGEQIDIHTGGIDHIHIHHTNEIAQTESVTNKQFVNYWMHVNFLQLEKTEEEISEQKDDAEIKMSKSKGTAYTIDDLIDMGFDSLSLKYFYLTAHYRNELKFNFDILKSSERTFNRLQHKVYDIRKSFDNFAFSNKNMNKDIVSFLLDDLDTPKALAKFHEVLNSDESNEFKLNAIHTMDALFGLDLALFKPKLETFPQDIIDIAEKRLEARKDKDWAKSDELRDKLNSMGYSVKDEKDGYVLNKI